MDINVLDQSEYCSFKGIRNSPSLEFRVLADSYWGVGGLSSSGPDGAMRGDLQCGRAAWALSLASCSTRKRRSLRAPEFCAACPVARCQGSVRRCSVSGWGRRVNVSCDEGGEAVTDNVPAGWYPDPEGSAQQRYWDGNAWTESYAPAGPAAAEPAPVKKPVYKRTWFIVVAVLLGLGVIGNMVGGTPPTSEPTPTAGEIAAPAANPAPATPAAEPAPEPVPQPEPVPAAAPEPDMTMGQKQAIAKAEAYLSMGGFSRKALIEQLVYEDFDKADAEFAVKELSPDWNAQAEIKAQAYVDMGGFSKQGLIDQLVYEGFTKAQAAHGVKAAGY